jgi:hypothetical protein
MKSLDCPYCRKPAVCVPGTVIYPHRADLSGLYYWHCAPCDAYVGCHRAGAGKGNDGRVPLGRLANPELRRAKQRAHAAFDPMWRNRTMSRSAAYIWLAQKMRIPGVQCHIGMFDVAQCEQVSAIIMEHRSQS